MKEFKVYTSKGIYTVSDVTCEFNAEKIVKSNLGEDVQIFDIKEIDDHPEEIE